MPKPCTVCSHMERATIDMRLAVQVVNVAEVARSYGLKPDALHRHRARHLPEFLPAFAAQAQPLKEGTIEAEAQRLYLVTLDALARAQAGVLVHIDGEATQVSKVSMSTVARLIRESRAGLDLLHKLSVASGASAPLPSGVDRQLDERLIKALDRVADRRSHDATSQAVKPTLSIDSVEYAEVIEAEQGQAPTLATGGGTRTPTPGPSTAARGADLARLKESQRVGGQNAARSEDDGLADLPPVIPSNMSAEEARKFYEDGPTISVADRPEWSKPPVWKGNPAATDEEKRAVGFEPLPLTGPAAPAHPEIPLGNLDG